MTLLNENERAARSSALHHDSVSYENGQLFIEEMSVGKIADAIPTPFYCYSAFTITNAYRLLADKLGASRTLICFAVKANSNVSVLRLLSGLGCGMDIVSGGELERAFAAGAPPSKIVFSGVGKTRAEISRALEVGIHQINVESPAELDVIRDIARSLGRRAPIAFRVNPDVDAKTHAKISTGKKGDKFGIPLEEIPELYARAEASAELDVVGLAVHIGSQLLDLSPYRVAYERLADLVKALRSCGHLVRRLDLGGGLGISYDFGAGPDVGAYAKIIEEAFNDIDCELTVEPGRWLVGPAGLLVTEVLYVKNTGNMATVIVDAAMNDLMRPSLYSAIHPVLPLQDINGGDSSTYQLVGPVCETSDVFGNYEGLPKLRAGARLAFGCAGAYGASMASTYNSRDLIAEVLVDGARFRVIRRRQTIEDLLTLEVERPWQASNTYADAATAL
ncbi:diaminopimelate decarboxylase [Rhizobium sp. 25PS6]|uniref:Diaminopimelate decarboxylase n=5 Tax=Rhizobium TaxID=379 RepID=A0A3S0XA71_9HYPH|nr:MULTISPECIES: diaminopimelate decarboxylase [Rhizobium]MDR9776321.1 diaminopimelate decarboxylase [Rhizobium hidalgonense]MDR9785470.1 diaminopimelate decarboxylase [Rhizobium redzepovicii]MDR9815040.1 diaminopimelate decarboxylase [Rhizobium hidalgonense]MDR9822769.1 diaminopimelate decarboxylase [Rhizobium hidalgonense]MDU0364789.1 diaminopimelate decarboxylase [Rhizobium sp. 25PS6]